jgi:hypothetical protein
MLRRTSDPQIQQRLRGYVKTSQHGNVLGGKEGHDIATGAIKRL